MIQDNSTDGIKKQISLQTCFVVSGDKRQAETKYE